MNALKVLSDTNILEYLLFKSLKVLFIVNLLCVYFFTFSYRA